MFSVLCLFFGHFIRCSNVVINLFFVIASCLLNAGVITREFPSFGINKSLSYHIVSKRSVHLYLGAVPATSRGGALANLAHTDPLTLTFQISSTLAAHAQSARSPAGNQSRTRKSGALDEQAALS